MTVALMNHIVSKGSEARDRIEKWELYQKLPSLQQYVLVTRSHMYVEMFNRRETDWSGYQMLDTPEALLC